MAERRGIGVDQFHVRRDNLTDELAEDMAAEVERKLGGSLFLMIARFERKYADVNRPVRGAYESDGAKPYYESYHHGLTQMCRMVRAKWGRGLLLDIHGQGAETDTVYRGTYNGKTVSALIDRCGRNALSGPDSVLGHLERKGYRVTPGADSTSAESRYLGGFIVQTYGSHRPAGIDAIQLEFGTSFRRRRSLERTAGDVAEAITVFAQQYLPGAGYALRIAAERPALTARGSE